MIYMKNHTCKPLSKKTNDKKSSKRLHFNPLFWRTHSIDRRIMNLNATDIVPIRQQISEPRTIFNRDTSTWCIFSMVSPCL